MELMEPVSSPVCGKKFQRRVYGRPSCSDGDKLNVSVLETFPLPLMNEYEMNEPGESLFRQTEEEEEEDDDDDSTATQDIDERGSIVDDSEEKYNEQDEPLIQDSTQANVDVDLTPEEGWVESRTEEEISSRRRSRRVLDRVSKQVELMGRTANILAETDKLFRQFTPTQRDSITVRDVVELLEENLQFPLTKDEKKQVRGRLTELNTALVTLHLETAVNGHPDTTLQEATEEADMEEPIFDKDDSDYEAEHRSKRKASTNRKDKSAVKRSKKKDESMSHEKKTKKSRLNPANFALHRETLIEPKDDESSNRSPRTKTKRVPAHLKIHLDMKKKREDKIRQEEAALKNQQNEKVNEEDRLLAQLIARKFETENDELRVQRAEERWNLLERLEKRRWGVLHSSSLDMDGMDVPLSLLPLHRNSSATVTDPNPQTNDPVIMQEDNSWTDDGDSQGTDEELEIVHSNGQAAPPATTGFIASAPTCKPAKQISPKSIMDFFIQKKIKLEKSRDSRKKVNTVVSRSALMNMLRIKQFQAGNQWLAR